MLESDLNTNQSESKDDPIVEIFKISGSEYVKKSQISDLDVRAMVIRCTTCLHQINHHDIQKIKKHRRLDILVCKECFEFYGNNEFSQDESGNYNYCTWCGNGGKLYLCDFCPNVFCSTCVRRNFGRAEVSVMSKEGWKCYCCDPKKLKPKVAFCDLIIEYCNNEMKRAERRQKKLASEALLKTDVQVTCTESQDWVLPVFDQFNDACHSFHKRLDKLKQVGVSQSKSLKHVIKKLEEIVTTHKTELGQTMKSLTNQYTMYINNKIKAEERKKKAEADKEKANLNEAGDAQVIDLVNNLDSDDQETNKNEASGLKEVKSKSYADDPNYLAKMSLLHDSSSEGNLEDECDKLNGESDLPDNISGKVSDVKNDQSDAASDVKNDQSDAASDVKNDQSAEESDVKKNVSNEASDIPEKADTEIDKKCDLDASGELFVNGETEINDGSNRSDSPVVLSDSDDELKKDPDFMIGSPPEVEKTTNKTPQAKLHSSVNNYSKKTKNTPVKERHNRCLKFSDSEASSIELLSDKNDQRPTTLPASSEIHVSDPEVKKPRKQTAIRTGKPLISIQNDSKLQSQCTVVLKKCDNLLPNGETTIPLPGDYLLDDLDKEIDNLCKFPKKIKRDTPSKGKTHVEKKKSKAPKAEDDHKGESSSSICLSSSGSDSEEEATEKTSKKGPKKDDPNFIAKKELLESSEEESSLSIVSSEELEEKEEAKKKSKRGKARTDSSDDFQPRKKKKFDKLLSKRISSDDDSNSGQERMETDKTKKRKKKRAAISDEESGEKKKNSDSVHTTESDSESDNKKKKKRRIKKRAKSSSEESGKEADGSQNTPGKGRKNIKKILHQKDLATETKDAQLLERERKKRVLERQKLYNVIHEQAIDGNETVVRKLVLEVDPVSKEEVVQIHPDLIDKLKLHQVNGVKFMWECTIESLKELQEGKGSGCILAHCMGLGKTLQVITFLHTCLTNPAVSKKIRTAMVICPYNTVLNWRREFDKWLDEVSNDIQVYEMTVAKDNFSRLDILKFWQREGGVLIISYDIFRRLAAKKIPKMSKKNKEKIEELLINPGADIVICDEGHVLKNVKSAISVACSQIATERRIVLTGTPLQNNLEEYHCMLSFVKPHLLGTPKEFRNRFVHPIMNGQYDDSNDYDVKRMKKRIHILHKLLDGCVQRCDYSALTKFLPPKYEYVISVKLSEIQVKMYQWYLDNLSKARGEEKIRGGTLFQDYNVLRNLCAHPYIVHISFQKVLRRKEMQSDDEDMEDFIDDGDVTSKSDSQSSETEEVVKKYKTRRTRLQSGSDGENSVEEDDAPKKEWYHQFISDEDSRNYLLSGKMVLLAEILKECEAVGDKVVLFSQSLLTLDSVEDILEYLDELPVSEEDKKRDVMCRWVKNVDYFRMDGSTSADFRKSFIDRFNAPDNDRARLFLVSTRAGGLGTNLVGANRVIMLDASWNPSHDVQAIFRVYRFGQTKPVYIYRLLCQGTMEEKIYDRQVTKLSLSIRVVDEQQIDRHFNAAELAELYKFEPEVQRERPTPMLPKDTLLAEMLIKQSDWIIAYHEHDSLLENKTEEDLTEEERQAAWNEYENEREGRASDHYSIDEEIAMYLKEPDFDLANYEGVMIPTSKQIIEDFVSNLRKKFPTSTAVELRKRLLMMTFSLRAAFQEKHVKILRIKQDYVARGSVPSAVNKYLEELNNILKDLTQHYEKISEMIRNDARQAQQARIAQMQMNQAAFQMNQANANLQQRMVRPQMFINQQQQYGARPNFNPNYVRLPGYNVPGFRLNVAPTQETFMSEAQKKANVTAQTMFGNMVDRMYQNMNKYGQAPATTSQPVITEVDRDDSTTSTRTLRNPNAKSSQPVITEVDRDDSTSTRTLRKPKSSSTVVIEEIE